MGRQNSTSKADNVGTDSDYSCTGALSKRIVSTAAVEGKFKRQCLDALWVQGSLASIRSVRLSAWSEHRPWSRWTREQYWSQRPRTFESPSEESDEIGGNGKR